MKNFKIIILAGVVFALISALSYADKAAKIGSQETAVNDISSQEPKLATNDTGKPNIQGQWTQGALLVGKTHPSTRVLLGDRKIHVDSRGQFVFGLGRDADPKQTLKLIYPDGQSSSFEYQVTQRKYDIQYVEGVAQKYVAPPKEVSERITRDNVQIKKARATNRDEDQYSAGFTWPLLGKITGVYGSQRVFNGVPKRPHFGLDIAGPVGEPVYAPAPGIVSLAHDDMYYSGGTLIMDHGQGVSSTFIHLSKVTVKEGDKIERGQKIGEVGATGRATGPHLDWRINWFEQRLDPYLLLPPMPTDMPTEHLAQ
ncbi:Murein DD-endopeptidase MepM [Thalassocella blandensis]|nr:Murein DD-endopeptidase MepM [Thalassocella blandensis]